MNEPTSRKPRVAIVFGGRSSEHGISCVTAGSVLAAIDRDKYDVIPVGIAPDGRWIVQADDPAKLAIRDNRLPSVDPTGPAVALVGAGGSNQLVVSDPSAAPAVLGDVDVVFPLLHGPWGEDGTIQGMLDLAGVHYVGSGVLSSALGMDKVYMKIALEAAGLPVTPGIVVTRREWERDPEAATERIEALGYPTFAKPPRSGSSIGISRVTRREEIAPAMEMALQHDAKVLVEVGMVGAREIECGVLGTLDGGAEASRTGEVRAGGEHTFYDFEAKYLSGQETEIDLPAVLPDGVEETLRDMAVRGFEALACEGLARVDFFLMPDGEIVINEINTMPGFTPSSMFPQMWAERSMAYPDLIDRLLTLALSRTTGLR